MSVVRGLTSLGLGAAGVALSPFTLGTSLALSAPAFASGAFDLFGGGGGGTPSHGGTPAGPDLNTLLNQVSQQKNAATAQGNQYKSLSADTLQPVLEYFRKLTSNDPNATLAATAPDRARVIDQYDTARQAIAQFTPRGGGQNAALATSRFSQADEMSNLASTARTTAMGQSSQLGQFLASLGLSEEQIASGDLSTIINAVLQQKGMDVTQHGQNLQALGSAGEGIGTLLGLLLTRGAVQPGGIH